MEAPIKTVDDLTLCKTSDVDLVAWLRFVHQRGKSRKVRLQSLLHNDGHIQAAVGRSKAPLSDSIKAEVSWLQTPGHYFIPITDLRYPHHLRQIPDPPLGLYAAGDLALLQEPQVSIVGSRRPSPVGQKITQQIAQQLAQLGLVITSGMALGIDGLAHQGALGAPDGKSIAVLAHGLDSVYPQRHRQLFQQLLERGLVVSEYSLGVSATKHRFPERNRIVAGLSLGVIIVEAAERSGTLITARLAGEQNRELMVVPGSAVSAQYCGSHRLIQQGAALITSAQDVVACLQNQLQQSLACVDGCIAEQSLESKSNHNRQYSHPLLEHIGAESTPIDVIILASGMTAAEVSNELLMLEMQGQIAVSLDGGFVNLM